MELMEVIRSRHSVRQYLSKGIEEEKRRELDKMVKECNDESGLHMQIIYDDPNCFKALLSKVLSFKNCTNYIAVVGKTSDPELEVKGGYFGEKLVLKAQELGLNTCWVGKTYGKCLAKVGADEKLVIVIALGYGENQGRVHKNRPMTALSNVTENLPDWYALGLEAAMLAPTAINQQKFKFTLEEDGSVKLTSANGPFAIVDMGIVKCHFEMASGHVCS